MKKNQKVYIVDLDYCYNPISEWYYHRKGYADYVHLIERTDGTMCARKDVRRKLVFKTRKAAMDYYVKHKRGEIKDIERQINEAEKTTGRKL